MLLGSSAVAAAICPAETNAEWASASATRKRELLRECQPPPVEPVQESLAPDRPPETERGYVPARSPGARRSAQLLGASITTMVAVGGLAATLFPLVGMVGFAVGGLAAIAIVPVVMLTGWGERQWGLPLLGTVLGTTLGLVAMVGAAVGGVLIGWSGDTINFGSIVGGVAGLLLTLPLPVLGAVFGYELGLKGNQAPQVALVPLNGGMMAALSARF
jgi:hypothetical protein